MHKSLQRTVSISDKAKADNPGILAMLTSIEKNLNSIVEVRDYLTGNLRPSMLGSTSSAKKESAKNVFELEREIEKKKKDDR